jgi:hypothetical protein
LTRISTLATGLLLAWLAFPGTALAGDLDQQQTNTDGFTSVASGQSLAQTFTAGRSGLLDQVDLDLQRSGTPPAMSVELRNVSAGVPGTQVLASASVAAASVPTTVAFVPIQFPAPAPVTAATQYAIVAYATSSMGNFYLWADKGGNPYAGGTDFASAATPPNTTWADRTPIDTTFKTYVAPPASTNAPPGPTGQRAAALKKCKKKRTKTARKKCRNKAKKLPL